MSRLQKRAKTPSSINPIISSFKDPSGFVFVKDGILYRQINNSYQKNYDLLIKSGLYDKLTDIEYLVKHKEVDFPKKGDSVYKIIQPEKIPFVSYSYEWSFSMLKEAALLTLNIQKIALEHNMSLKDASSFNVQFLNGKPIFIDTLSFEKYQQDSPWVAYKQFVEHFLSPLALMSFNNVSLNRLGVLFLDGVPLELASNLLPFRSRLRPSLFMHIHAHAKSQKKYSNQKLTDVPVKKKFSKLSFLALLDSLEGTIKSLSWKPEGTEWTDYYDSNNNYQSKSLDHKTELIKDWSKKIKPKVVWDMGANTGVFSRAAAFATNAQVMSFDIDQGALERNYLEITKKQEKNILPLFCDLTNPTPSIGWANQERLSLWERGNADLVLALALVHHLSISKNVPFSYIASVFAKMGKYLVIEFVPKADSQVKILLANRKDVFVNYDQKNFEADFKAYFNIKKVIPIKDTKRILYLMERQKNLD